MRMSQKNSPTHGMTQSKPGFGTMGFEDLLDDSIQISLVISEICNMSFVPIR